MPVTPDTIAAAVPLETGMTRSRRTLSVRAGSVSCSDVASTVVRRVNVDRTGSNHTALGTQNGVVPLKRLTEGRKEIKIAHDGATYLLRITKSNKLILTKAGATPPASTA